MKICHVCNSHGVDDGRVFHRACVALAEAGYEVHLFAVGKEQQPYRQKGVFIHPLPQSSGRFQRFSRRSRIAKMAAALIHNKLMLFRSASAVFRSTCSTNSNPSTEKTNIQPN